MDENCFANPEKLSLSQLNFQVMVDGLLVRVPALDKYWTRRTKFTNSLSLIKSGAIFRTGTDLEEWISRAQSVRLDMLYLLTRPHHVFWSYMVYERSAHTAVVTFLQNAIPFFAVNLRPISLDGDALNLYNELFQLATRIICRLLTNRESAEAWIIKDQLRDLIYDKFLITVPILFDLIIAVGDATNRNALILRNIFDTLLKIEPNYCHDLRVALEFFRTAFNSIDTQTENDGFDGAGGGALDDHFETPFDDVVLFTMDCAYTLSVLLDICRPAIEVCGEIKMGQMIAHFYDKTIPKLYIYIFQINENAKCLGWLNQARSQFLRAFNRIASFYVAAAQRDREENSRHGQNFVALLTECLADHTFVVDYQSAHPVEGDMEILKNVCKDFDKLGADFVTNGYQKEAHDAAHGTIKNIELLTQSAQAESEPKLLNGYSKQELQKQNGHLDDKKTESVLPVNVKTRRYSCKGCKEGTKNVSITKSKPRDLDLEATIVLDVFPDLDINVIMDLLKRYSDYSEVIIAITDGNLPPDIVAKDKVKNESYKPVKDMCIGGNKDKRRQTNVHSCTNGHDGAFYDMETEENPSYIVKPDKDFPNAPRNATELLDDKTDVLLLRNRYQQLSLVSDDEEYDDSYDAIAENTPTAPKTKDLQKALANITDKSGESEVEEDPKNFCKDPAIQREAYEANRIAKWRRKQKTGNKRWEKHTVDVAGTPKGQGQNKETQNNRKKKTVQKSKCANHNRKAGSDYKRKNGMF